MIVSPVGADGGLISRVPTSPPMITTYMLVVLTVVVEERMPGGLVVRPAFHRLPPPPVTWRAGPEVQCSGNRRVRDTGLSRDVDTATATDSGRMRLFPPPGWKAAIAFAPPRDGQHVPAAEGLGEAAAEPELG